MTSPDQGLLELAACPFCASKNIDREGWMSLDPDGEKKTGPACDDCGASAGSVEQWNTRAHSAECGVPPSAAVREALEYVRPFFDVNCPDVPGAHDCLKRIDAALGLGESSTSSDGARLTTVRKLVDDPNSASGKSLRDVEVSPTPAADREAVAREALDLLSLQQIGRARALRLLDGSRKTSDPETLARADAYEECGKELRAILSTGARR